MPSQVKSLRLLAMHTISTFIERFVCWHIKDSDVIGHKCHGKNYNKKNWLLNILMYWYSKVDFLVSAPFELLTSEDIDSLIQLITKYKLLQNPLLMQILIASVSSINSF